jgi:Cu-processing system permease protein
MRPIGLVTVNVFKESVRDKVLYGLVVFGVLLIAASYLLGQLSAGQDVKIIKDLGLASIAAFGLVVAIFIGVGLVWKEVERRSIHSVLSKPISRGQFVVGKYCGLVLTLLVNVGLMTIAFYIVLAYMGWREDASVRATWPAPATDPNMLVAVLLTFMELMIVTSIALFFSTFSTPLLSAILTLGLWVIGQFSADLRNFETMVESPVAGSLTRFLYYVLPNFSAFDVKTRVVYGESIDLGYVSLTGLYGLTYVALVLVAAMTIFSRRDF